MKLLKGIIHVHSSYSYDGQHSLEEIAQYGVKRGYSFIGMSEHSDTLNRERMAKYVKDCQAVSTSSCLVIPGIEFTCENNLHLVGLGVREYTDTKDPIKVTRFIHQQRGIAIVAHPIRYRYQIPQNLAGAVDGIEVWNAAYDGRFVPNDRSLNLLKDFRNHNRPSYAFGAQDLHQITDHSHVQITVSCDDLKEDTILKALKEGNFKISNPYFAIDSRCEPGWPKLVQIYVARRMYYLAKWIRDH